MAPRRRPRGTTVERGYGAEHRKQRAKWKRIVDAGQGVCARCRWPIPAAGMGRCPRCGKNHRGWDLGHADWDRSMWTGPEHVCCNRATAGRRMVKRVQRAMWRVTREW